MSKTMDKLAKELKAQMNASDARKPKPYDAQAEVLRVEDGVAWVHIPGGVEETPVRLTINAKKGDMVNIRVANGSAWITGNGTNPPTDDSTANYAVDITNSLNQDVVVLNTVVAENIEATNARFGNVEADTAKIHNLEADEIHAGITYTNELIAEDVTTENLTAASGYIQDLTADNITANDISAASGYIQDLTADNITANDISAASGYIQDLTADHITAGDISAASGYIKDLTADHITAGDIIADHATIDDLDANYAQINMANVNNAWIENGTIKKAEVFDENVFDLSGNKATIARIDASKINVANLRADNLVVRRINGQPVVGGYTLIDSNSPGYSSKNPQALGWYEFVNANWVLSQDTTVDMTKAYYQEGNEVSLYDQAYIDGLESDLQQQIDGAVETFTGSVVPTLTNWPYTDWYDTSVTPIHDERAKHVGDIYYVVNSSSPQGGYCYRFAYDNTTHAYSWVLIKDSDVTKALSDISELQTFESETTSWIDETDQGLETIRTNHTNLVGVVDKTVKESVQLWFTKANTTAPNKPTAEVTSTSTAGNAWRKVVPAYNASYPHYFYCWQYKFVDGTFGWSDVVRDIAMGETQGTARDAKNTADAALPAQTFEVFESTTFTDLVDEVDEQSTTMTNMTTRLGLNADGTQSATDIVSKESALEQTVNGISTRVGKTEAHLIGMYATSSTAAGTAAKVATITPAIPSGTNWELSTGTTITVKFTNANTTASPTLNVNSKGAKPIKTYANANLTEAEYKWKAGSTFTFTYNGTNWLMQDSTASVRMSSNETSITQTATSIESLASGNTTYTKPDGTTATSAIGTTVSQTANNVLIKATRTGATDADKSAGGTSAVGLINVSPDNVTIAANKVNITGTSTFSSGQTFNDLANASVQVGGRNLLLRNKYRVSGTSNGITFSSPENADYITITGTSTGLVDEYIADMSYITATNTYVTVSVDYVFSNAENYFYFSTTKNGAVYKDYKQITYYSPTERRLTVKLENGETLRYLRAHIVSGTTLNNTYHFKVEVGNKQTAWTPAPEDVQAEIDAKKSIHTLDTSYSYTYANIFTYSAEGYSGTWTVSSTSGVKVGDTVRLKVTVSNMSNAPVYVVGTVTEVTNTTKIKMTSHGLDTTIIDGGNILTGTVTADQIHSNAITADKIQAGAVKASKIAIHDFENYVTVNEKDANSMTSSAKIVDGWITKTIDTNTNIHLSEYLPNWTTKGEKYRVTGTIKAPKAGRAAIYIVGRNADGTYNSGSATSDIALSANTSTAFDLIITITEATANCVKSNIVIYFYEGTTGSTYQNGYCQNMRVARMTGGELLVDGSISTKKLAVGDWTNLVTANELYPESLPTTSVVISDGWLAKKSATQQYILLTKNNPVRTPNTFKTGDELYVDFYAKAASATTIIFCIYAYNSANEYIGGDTLYVNNTTTIIDVPTSEKHITGTITLTSSVWNNAAYYEIDVNNNATTKVQVYVRKVVVRMKSAGELIVDGAITASKLQIGQLTSGTINYLSVIDNRRVVAGRDSNIKYGFNYQNGRYQLKTHTAVSANTQYSQIYNLNLTESYNVSDIQGKDACFAVDWVTITDSNLTTDWRIYLTFYDYNSTNLVQYYLDSTKLVERFKVPGTAMYTQVIIRMSQSRKAIAAGVAMTVAGLRLNAGNVLQSWSLCPDDEYTDGDNVLKNSDNITANDFYVSNGTYGTATWGVSMTPPGGKTVKGVRVKNTDVSSYVGIAQTSANMRRPLGRGVYTVSAWVLPSANGQVTLYPYMYTSSDVPYGGRTFNVRKDYWAKLSWTAIHDGAHSGAASHAGGYVYYQGSNNNDTCDICCVKLEAGSVASGWCPAESELAARATNYITEIDNGGIRIHPEGNENDRITLTGNGMYIYKGDVQQAYFEGANIGLGRNDSNQMTLNSGGAHIYNIVDSTTGRKEVALFGSTARVGRADAAAFHMNASSLQAYYMNGSTRTKYFEVSPSGISFGNKTQADILNDNVKVGGANLLRNSKIRKSGTANGITFASSSSGPEYVSISGTSTALVNEYVADLKYLTGYPGTTVTISANYVFGSDAGAYFYVSTTLSDGTIKDYADKPIVYYSSTERRTTITLASGETLRYLRLVVPNGKTINGSYRFKIELGNKQTDWSPCPDDVDDDIQSAKAHYGICDTQAATAAKVTNTISGFALYDGAEVGIRFNNGNTVKTGITLNVSGTGAKPVNINGSTGKSPVVDTYGILHLIYDSGSGVWRVTNGGFEKTATSYITDINSDGIFISPSSQSPSTSAAGNSVKIDGTGMNVYKEGTSVAFYGGEEARIGKALQGNVTIKNTGIDMYGYEPEAQTPQLLLCHIGYGNCIAESGTEYGPYYTFGTRLSDSSNGLMSMAEGYSCESSGFVSHAEGFLSRATKTGAHAEGTGTATADYAHAEGDSDASGKYSHAEGNTYATANYAHSEGYLSSANGVGSHAEGNNTRALGNYSHASGVHTSTGYEAQFAVGTYNRDDSTYIFMVGNGSSSKSSNAFAVTKTGTIIIGDHSSSVGSVLRAKSSITSLATSTAKALTSLTIPIGTWILVGKCRFGGKAGNVRRLVISTTSGDIDFATMAKTDGTGTGIQVAPGTSTAAVQHQVTHIVSVTANTTFYFNAWHNAGSTLDIAIAQLEAVRIA